MSNLSAIKAYIEHQSGLHFSEARLHLLDGRIKERMKENCIDDENKYLLFLKFGSEREQELESLFSALTTHETRFLRIPHQFELLSSVLLRKMANHRQKYGQNYLHIWSAGCSTGEEAYTLAISIIKAQLPKNIAVSILATDIDKNSIQTAKLGRYKHSRLSGLSDFDLFEYFTRNNDGAYSVRDHVKAMVKFVKHNLVADPFLYDQDLIMCRNVTIYFNQETRASTIRRLSDSLRNGGILMLGESEILPQSVPNLKLRTDNNTLYFEKVMEER